MRVYWQIATQLFLLITLLVFGFAFVVPAPQAPIAAYNGHCEVFRGGTCLVDINTGISIRWATFGSFVTEWSGDMYANAFVSPSDYVIYSYSWETNSENALTARSNVRNFAPTLSPDNTQVAYALSAADSVSVQIRIINRDGTDDRYMTTIDLSEGRFTGELFWSPDMRYLAYFTSERSPLSGVFSPLLWILDIETGKARAIDSVSEPVVAWSPDGQHVAYVPINTDMVVIIEAATGNVPDAVREFIDAPADMIVGSAVSYPSFSPDGSKLMFIDRDRRANTTTINTRDLTTGDIKTLTTLNDATIRFEDAVWIDAGIIIVEDRAPSSYADYLVFHHVDPQTGTRTQLSTMLVEDYIQMVKW